MPVKAVFAFLRRSSTIRSMLRVFVMTRPRYVYSVTTGTFCFWRSHSSFKASLSHLSPRLVFGGTIITPHFLIPTFIFHVSAQLDTCLIN